jgi:hypothetical protein
LLAKSLFLLLALTASSSVSPTCTHRPFTDFLFLPTTTPSVETYTRCCAWWCRLVAPLASLRAASQPAPRKGSHSTGVHRTCRLHLCAAGAELLHSAPVHMSRRISLLCTPHSTPWPSRVELQRASGAYYISCCQAMVPRMHMFECSSGRCFRNVSSGFAGASRTTAHATPTQRGSRCSPLRSSSTSSSSPSLMSFSIGCCCCPLRQWSRLHLKAPPPLCSHESTQPKPTSTLDL